MSQLKISGLQLFEIQIRDGSRYFMYVFFSVDTYLEFLNTEFFLPTESLV